MVLKSAGLGDKGLTCKQPLRPRLFAFFTMDSWVTVAREKYFGIGIGDWKRAANKDWMGTRHDTCCVTWRVTVSGLEESGQQGLDGHQTRHLFV